MTDTFPIEGFAAIYDEPDLNGDVVAPGAFKKSLAKTSARAVKLLYQHTAEKPVGRWLSFEERPRGLYARGELFLATETAREVAELIAADIIDGLSIGFRTVKAQKSGGVRRITEAELWEVSIVTFPMAPKARIVRPGPPRDQSIRPSSLVIFGAKVALGAHPRSPGQSIGLHAMITR